MAGDDRTQPIRRPGVATGRSTMLTDLVTAATRQTAQRRRQHPEAVVERRARTAHRPRDFTAALSAPGLGVIAEMKPRSPSAGPLTEVYDPAERARQYHRGGAAAVSVLTHEDGFGGSPEHLQVVRAETDLPILRKDFIIDEYQVLEARALGADAVLLIVAALPACRLAQLMAYTRRWGMEAVVEVHDADEVDVALSVDARVIGVNHRDLRDFEVDMTLTARLRDQIGPSRALVAESGVRTAEDARNLRAAGADAVLVGEMLMRSADAETTIKELTRE